MIYKCKHYSAINYDVVCYYDYVDNKCTGYIIIDYLDYYVCLPDVTAHYINCYIIFYNNFIDIHSSI